MTVVEHTGGSTGSWLALVYAVKGLRVSSDVFAEENLQTMKAFGADLITVAGQGDAVFPDLTPG